MLLLLWIGEALSFWLPCIPTVSNVFTPEYIRVATVHTKLNEIKLLIIQITATLKPSS